jgi:hypothetical protein
VAGAFRQMSKKSTKGKTKKQFAKAKTFFTKKRQLKRAQKSLVLIALICAASVLFVNWLGIDQNLKYSVIAEIIGSGIVAGLISYFFFELQNANEYEASKNRAESYYKKKALPDIQEVFESEQSISWSINLGKEFYLSASLINPLYNAYEENLDVVIDYQSYFPNDVLLKSLDALYLLSRKVYVQGEILDNALRRIIRVEHNKKAIHQMHDGTMLAYVKAKLFAGVPNEEVSQFLDWSNIHDRTEGMIQVIEKDASIKAMLEQLQALRKPSLQLVEVIKAIKDTTSKEKV